MSIRDEYRKRLKTLHRVLGQLKKRGITSDYSEVKRPTQASIKRLEKEIEKVRTKAWLQKLPKDKEPEKKYPEEWELYISLFKKQIEELVSNNYIIKPTNKKPYDGRDKSGSRKDAYYIYLDEQQDTLEDKLEEAIAKRGRMETGMNIKKYTNELVEAMDNLVYNLYSYLEHMGKDYTDETYFKYLIDKYLING